MYDENNLKIKINKQINGNCSVTLHAFLCDFVPKVAFRIDMQVYMIFNLFIRSSDA